MSMKEANRIIRDKFDTGVSPPLYSKVKKQLEAQSSEEKPQPEAEVTPEPVDSKENNFDAPETETQLLADEFFSSSEEDKKESEKLPIENSSPSLEKPATFEAQTEEADPIPLNTHPVTLKVQIFEKLADTVHLSGSFNKWKKGEYPLKKEGLHWVFEGELPEGEHHYKFIVNENCWYLDMEKDLVSDETGISHPIKVPA